MNKQDLSFRIDKMKAQLVKLVEEKGLNHTEVIEYSQELDAFILEEQKKKMKNKVPIAI